MNQDDYIKSLTAGASTPAAAAPQPMGLMDSLQGRLYSASQGDYPSAFASEATPMPEEAKHPWWGGGVVSDAAMGAMQLPKGAIQAGYRKSQGLPVGATEFGIEDIARQKPKNVSGGFGYGAEVALAPEQETRQKAASDAQEEIYKQAIAAYQAGDKVTASQLLDEYKKQGGFEGAVGSTLMGFGTDPAMVASLGPKVGAVLAPAMISGGVKAAKQYYDTGMQKGFTSPESVIQIPETVASVGMGALTGSHLIKATNAHYINRSGKAAAGDARAPFPSDSGTSTSGTTPADVSAPRVETPVGVSKGFSTAGMFSIPDPSAIKAPPLKSKIEGVAERANQVLNETISERTKRAHEGVEAPADYEIDASSMMTPAEATKVGMTDTASQRMPDTFGGGFNKDAAQPTKIRILDEATIQELEAKYPGESVRDKVEATIAFQHAGTIYVGEAYKATVLAAKTPAEAISTAIGLVAHERMHGTQRADKFVRPDTARYDPMTGEQIPEGSPLLATSPHDRGKFNDNTLRDVEGAIRARSLEQTAEADPRIRQLRQAAEADPALAGALTREGTLPGGGTYLPEVSRLAEGLVEEPLAPGGRSWSEDVGARPDKSQRAPKKETIEAASKVPINEERIKNIGEIVAQRFGKLPSKDRARAVKAYLDGAVEHQAITPGERSAAFKAYREAIAEGAVEARPEAIAAPPNPASGKADAMIAEAKAEVESKPPVTVPKTQMSVDEAHERALRPAQGTPGAAPVKDPWARGNKHNKPDYVSRTEWLQKVSDMGGPTVENLAKIGSSPEEYAARRKDVTSSRNSEYDKARGILSEHARLLAGRKLGKGASLRELGLNRRRLSRELAGEDTSNLPKSSQDLASPAASVRGVQAAVAEVKKPIIPLLKKGGDPEVKKEAASRLDAIANTMRNAFLKIKGLSGAQAADVNNNIKGLTNDANRLREVAETEVARRARITEQLRVKEYKEAQARETERVKAEGKAVSLKKAVAEKKVKSADELLPDEPFEAASPVEKRLTAAEAAEEAKDLATERRNRTAKLDFIEAKIKKSQDYLDSLSIAKRDTDAGKKSRSSVVTKKGEVLQGEDKIGKAARDLKAGKKKLLTTRAPQGRLVKGGLVRVVPDDGRQPYWEGKTVKGTEAYSGPGHVMSSFAGHGRGSIVKGEEVLGDVLKGWQKGVGAGKTVFSKEGQVGTEPPVPKISKEVRDANAETTAADKARKEEARVAALERIKIGKAAITPPPSGTPKLTEGPVTQVAGKAIPKAFRRKDLVSGASKKAFEAERQALIGREIVKNDRVDLTPDKMIDSAVATGRISRASAAELRGMGRKELENFVSEKLEESYALKNAIVTEKQKDPIVYEAGRRKYVEQAVYDEMEAFNMYEDQLHADGRLRTSGSNKALMKKYGTTVRNLVEDFIDGVEIDPDGEYYINPRERAELKRRIGERSERDYDAEIASAEDAPPVDIRPGLAARLGKRAALPAQTMSAGGTNKLSGKGSGPESEAARITREAEGRAAPAARTIESTSYKTARYPTLESWANAGRPERALGLAPKKAQMGARKPGTAGTEGHGDVEKAMTRAADVGPGTNLFSKTSSTGKIYEKAGGAAAQSEASPEGLSTEALVQWMKEHKAASLERKAVRKLADESSKESHASGERLAPRVAEGARQAQPTIRNASTIKNLIGQIARETVGKGAKGREEFMSRIDDLIKKRVEAKDITPGTRVIEVREAALKRFERERAAAPAVESPFKRTETPRERAERVLGGEQFEGASPVLGRKKRADQGDIYAQAGEESYAKVPLNKTAEKGRRALELAEEASGVTKNLQTGFDVSATFRNTLGLTARQMVHDPAGFVKNFHKMVTSYSEKKFDQHVAQIEAQPEWQEALDSGLRLSRNASDHDLFQKTDHVANWIKAQTKSPHLVVRALAQIPEKGMLGAARAYTMYQNAVMMDAFKSGKKMLAQEGNVTPSKIREMNTVINMLGNRHQPGFLKGKENETWARAANTVLYSPNMIASAAKTIVNLGIPAEIGPRVLRAGREFESSAARKMFQQSIRSTMGFGTSVLALTYFAAQSAGLKPEIETDPVSNDFGTVRFGHTKVNPWGPYQQYVRMGAQVMSGKEKLRGSGRVQKTDISKIVSRWGRGKLSPLAGAAWSIGSGSTGAGRETASVQGRLNVLSELASPINLGDIKDIAQENPPALAAYLASLSTLGITVQSGTGTKPWISDPDMSATDVRVSDEIRRLKLEPPRISSRVPLKGRNAVGQKLYYSLSREEREKFTDEVMPIISKDIDTFIASDRYKNATEAVKKRLLFRIIKRENARYSASKRLKKTYAGATPVNDWWKDEED